VYPLPFPDEPLPANESPDPNSESYDILDEVLALFRANTFFRNFEIQGPADRLLVYGIWFVSDCLTKIKPNASLREATKEVQNLTLDLNFALPGDPAWPLNQVWHGIAGDRVGKRAWITDWAGCNVDVRAAARQARRGNPPAVHVSGQARAGSEVIGEGIRRGRCQAEQVVVELHQEEVYGQGAVRGDVLCNSEREHSSTSKQHLLHDREPDTAEGAWNKTQHWLATKRCMSRFIHGIE
jgi:hypothetical protein